MPLKHPATPIDFVAFLTFLILHDLQFHCPMAYGSDHAPSPSRGVAARWGVSR